MSSSRSHLFAAILCLAASIGNAATADLSKGKPPAVLDARVGANIRLGDDPAALPANQRGQAEPHIVRSAANPEVLLAAFQEGRYGTGGSGAVTCGYALSRDGGLTWTRALIPNLATVSGGRHGRATDPVAGTGPQGDLYLNTLASIGDTFGLAAVVVSRSTDQGRTWSAPATVFETTTASISPDKNWMGVNEFAGTPTSGRIAVSWTNFRTNASGVLTGTDLTLSISDDRGASWSAPVAVTPVGANDQGSLPYFLPDGTLLVIYATFFGNTPTFGIRCKRSLDGGRTFPAQATTVVNQINEWNDPQLREGAYLPAATVARQTGDVFVTYVGLVAPGQPRVFVTRSSDRGATWSAPVIVSDQPPGISVTNPAVAVTPDGRTVSIVYMDKRDAPGGQDFVDHYAALSFDGGATWQPNFRLTEMSSDVRFAAQTSGGYMLGDYIGVAPSFSPGQPFVAIWCDTRTGDADPMVVRFAATPTADFESWRIARFNTEELAGTKTGAAADFDNDGTPNLIEFDAATDPRVADSGETIVVTRPTPDTVDVAWLSRERGGGGGGFSASLGVVPPATFVLTTANSMGPSPAPEVATPAGLVWRTSRYVGLEGVPVVADRGRSLASTPAVQARESAVSGTDSRLINVSTRGRTAPGASQMIVGFVLDGDKNILLRAAGPALSALGVSGALGDPQLTLVAPASDLMRANDNWQQQSGGGGVVPQMGAFPFASNSLDSALLLPLGRQNYTASVTGANNSSGITLVEAYDADPAPGAPGAARFLNLSTRGEVGTGENALIAGFVVSGTQPRRLLIRAVGPGLAALGVGGTLVDPVLTLHRGNTPIATNDDWEISRSGAAIAATAKRTGAFALAPGSRDASLLITLVPGGYTVSVGSADGSTGLALVEIYDAD